MVVWTLLTQLCLLSSVLVLTRGLGLHGYGVLAFALAIQSYLVLLGGVGTKPVVLREGVARLGDLDRILTSHVIITATASGLLGLSTLFVVGFAVVSNPERVLLALLAIGNIAVCLNIAPLFDVHHLQSKSAAITLTAEFAAMTAILGLYWTGHLDLSATGGVYAAKWVMATAGHYLVYHCSVRRLRFTVAGETVHRMLQSGWPLMLSAVVATVPSGTGVLFLRLWKGTTEAAVFGVANQAAYAYLLFAVAGGRVLQTNMVGPHGLREDSVIRFAFWIVGFLGSLLLGALGAGCGVIFFLLEPSYHAAVVPMIIVLGGAFVKAAGIILSIYLVVWQRERIILIANACAALIYVCGCWFSIPRFAYNGAAFMTVLASFVGTGVIVLAIRARLNGKTLAPEEFRKYLP